MKYRIGDIVYQIKDFSDCIYVHKYEVVEIIKTERYRVEKNGRHIHESSDTEHTIKNYLGAGILTGVKEERLISEEDILERIKDVFIDRKNNKE